MLHFDTDYMEGAHPEVMKRLLETNLEQTVGYGLDHYCDEAKQLIKDACGLKSGKVFFLVGGTQTNSTVIDGILRRHEGVLCAATGHISVHESGAIEASGHKVLTLPERQGKVTADDVDNYITDFYRDETYEHQVAPGLLYISFPTEYGTIYSRSELEVLSAVCHKHGIPLFIDGARLGYGLASDAADLTLQDIAQIADVFYIGGTKVGALCGEAVVTKRDDLLCHFFPLIKQHGALLAKGRLLGVQFGALFTDGLYLKIARHAVVLAMKLRKAFEDKGYKVFIDSPTNQQFVVLPNETLDRLSKIATFEVWGIRGMKETPVRFVTSWATKEEDINKLIAEL